ncbi:serine/threonine-protein kinase [Streptomyces malaysiensis]|uniref:Serine/threonine protein kinase n=1 Tax=Streptomyces malaysiensis subsp. samsunensis TaxID=459658 RepID=A0A9X2M1Z2_STRMQ|nr:serine/threonine-protein kinase [Streptomyces samsunensis]MCQ8833812.1 serine/threonine protein kinase [Streptomyces samsunensis]
MSTEDPERFGPFLVLERLGAGGMGTVYLAQSLGGRRVAVKTIRADQAADPGARERFRREIDAARRVSGFWTAPVVDADPDAATPWVATAYLDAPDLGEHVRRHGPLPATGLLVLAVGLAEALAAIHHAGLTHRDLKPANILITEDGPRIIDFGIAREDTAATLTTVGGILGTPAYMSPEQAGGARTDPASDIFSLGAVLYYAATGTGPFGHGTIPALLHRVVHHDPDLTAIPDALRPALTACLHKEPRRRPTAAALLALLTNPPAPIDGGPPRAPEPAPAPRTPAWWEQPTPTVRYTVPLPPQQPPSDDSPAADANGWPVKATVPEPAGPAFATGAQAVLEYQAEHQQVRGRAPGPRVDTAAAGDVVQHDRFGIGTVIEVDGEGPHAVARVSFGPQKNIKRLQLRYAPMRKIGI